MSSKNYAEHARVTAICVNLALDGVEADLRTELVHSSDQSAAALERVLEKLRQRRLQGNEIVAASRC